MQAWDQKAMLGVCIVLRRVPVGRSGSLEGDLCRPWKLDNCLESYRFFCTIGTKYTLVLAEGNVPSVAIDTKSSLPCFWWWSQEEEDNSPTKSSNEQSDASMSCKDGFHGSIVHDVD